MEHFTDPTETDASQRLESRRDAVRKVGGGGLMIAGLGAALAIPGHEARAQPPVDKLDPLRPRRTAMWTHGNAATVETPENLKLVRHIGWATELFFIPGRSSWVHIPLPTPVIVGDVRAKLVRFFLMFRVPNNDGTIRSVHLYDGPTRIFARDGLSSGGDHWGKVDGVNTFNLDRPREVAWGLGISFSFQASIGFDTQIPPPLLQIASAGADYDL